MHVLFDRARAHAICTCVHSEARVLGYDLEFHLHFCTTRTPLPQCSAIDVRLHTGLHDNPESASLLCFSMVRLWHAPEEGSKEQQQRNSAACVSCRRAPLPADIASADALPAGTAPARMLAAPMAPVSSVASRARHINLAGILLLCRNFSGGTRRHGHISTHGRGQAHR